MMLTAARVLSAAMLVLGLIGGIIALNLGHSSKGDLPPNWPMFATCSAMAITGTVALYFIEPRMRRKN
jgi:hypothetical protein